MSTQKKSANRTIVDPAGHPVEAEHREPPAAVEAGLWQLHDRFILAQTGSGLAVIDQHSAHERILYEEVVEDLRQGERPAQRLLFPLVLHLTPLQRVTWETYGGMIARLGFEIETFGGDAVAVSAVPAFRHAFDPEEALAEARAAWPLSQLVHDPAATGALIRQLFDGAGDGAGTPPQLLLKGTNFQVKVWSALLRVPPGRVVSYLDLASAIGQPRAVRAVGAAVGRNNISWLIPCHRVVKKDGSLSGYRWGYWRKRALLSRERKALALQQGSRP